MFLLLASTSIHRAKQLRQLSYEFECKNSLVDEDIFKKKYSDPKLLCQRLAFEKAKAVHKKFPNAVVIGADQLIYMNKKIFGKPHTLKNASAQILEFNGKSQQLITSLCVLTPKKKYEHTDITELFMRKLSHQQIQSYVQSDQPLQCAGSICIEKTGLTLFYKINSQDHSAIMGLPLLTLCNILFENNIIPKSLH